MKKILCTVALASHFLLGIGDVSAIKIKLSELMATIETQDTATTGNISEDRSFDCKAIQLSDELLKESTPDAIANAIDSQKVETLPEFELHKKISLPDLINIFEMKDVEIISINNLIDLIPTIDGIKFVGGSITKVLASTLFPNIQQANSNDIKALTEKSAARIVKEYRIAKVENDAKENIRQGLDLQTFNWVIDSILRDDCEEFLEFFRLGASNELMRNCSLLAIISGSMKIVTYCVCNEFLSGISSNKIMKYASASGNVDIIHYLENVGLYDVKTALASITQESASFILSDVFFYLWAGAKITPNTYFLKLLIEERQLHLAIMCMNENEATINFNELLLSAAKGGYLQFVKYLVEIRNCRVEAKNNMGVTPLYATSLNGHLDIIKYLIKKHQEKNISINFDELLIPATENGHLKLVRYFIEEFHCDANVKDGYGFTPLHFASYYGYLDIVKYLVKDCHCNVNVKDEYNVTPLHFASYKKNLEVVKYLVEICHCDTEVRDDNHNTPLDVAGDDDTWEFLHSNRNRNILKSIKNSMEKDLFCITAMFLSIIFYYLCYLYLL